MFGPRHNRHMTEHWQQTITVIGLEGQAPYTLHCEPEGATHEVLTEDVLTLTFVGSEPHGFEISHVKDGLILCRLGDSEVTIDDKRGRPLRW